MVHSYVRLGINMPSHDYVQELEISAMLLGAVTGYGRTLRDAWFMPSLSGVGDASWTDDWLVPKRTKVEMQHEWKWLRVRRNRPAWVRHNPGFLLPRRNPTRNISLPRLRNFCHPSVAVHMGHLTKESDQYNHTFIFGWGRELDEFDWDPERHLQISPLGAQIFDSVRWRRNWGHVELGIYPWGIRSQENKNWGLKRSRPKPVTLN